MLAAQPLGIVLGDGSVGRADLSELAVVRPTEAYSVGAFFHRLLIRWSILRLRQVADLREYIHHAGLAQARADIGLSRTPAIVSSDPLPDGQSHKWIPVSVLAGTVG